jgi:non-heme chloroperoxidase
MTPRLRFTATVGLSAALALVGFAAMPEAQSGLATAFVKVESGITLQYVVQGDPNGPVIVLLHGAGDSWHSWELVLPHLPAAFRTYAVTLRGHGLSDHPDKGYARADFAADVTSLLKLLDLRRVTLVGHSLGSFVAQVVTQNDADGRIARLVLIGSGPGRPPDPRAASPLSSYFASVKDPISYRFARDFQAGTTFTPLPPAFLETMIAEVQRVPAAMFHELAKGVADPQQVEKLSRITAETLLVWGEKDAMFSKSDQDELLKIIPASRLIAYPNTGHALHWEQPERFARDLTAFVTK